MDDKHMNIEDEEFEALADNVATNGIAGKIEQSAGNGTNSQGVPDKRPCRNDPCHCGSERKYKKCCMEKDNDILADIERDKEVEIMHQMCEGRTPFKRPQGIKFIGAHIDGWMQIHLNNIKYLKSLISALKTLPAQGTNSFVTLHGRIWTRDGMIAEYQRGLDEMTGRHAREDYQANYALLELFKKDMFIGKIEQESVELTSPPFCGNPDDCDSCDEHDKCEQKAGQVHDPLGEDADGEPVKDHPGSPDAKPAGCHNCYMAAGKNRVCGNLEFKVGGPCSGYLPVKE